jgi:hypothetical protein
MKTLKGGEKTARDSIFTTVASDMVIRAPPWPASIARIEEQL